MRKFINKMPRLFFSISGMLLGVGYGYLATSQALGSSGEVLCGTGLKLIVPIWAFWGLLIGLLFGNEFHKFAQSSRSNV